MWSTAQHSTRHGDVEHSTAQGTVMWSTEWSRAQHDEDYMVEHSHF